MQNFLLVQKCLHAILSPCAKDLRIILYACSNLTPTILNSFKKTTTLFFRHSAIKPYGPLQHSCERRLYRVVFIVERGKLKHLIKTLFVESLQLLLQPNFAWQRHCESAPDKARLVDQSTGWQPEEEANEGCFHPDADLRPREEVPAAEVPVGQWAGRLRPGTQPYWNANQNMVSK